MSLTEHQITAAAHRIARFDLQDRDVRLAPEWVVVILTVLQDDYGVDLSEVTPIPEDRYRVTEWGEDLVLLDTWGLGKFSPAASLGPDVPDRHQRITALAQEMNTP